MRLTVNQVEHILERWHRLRHGNQVHFGSSDPNALPCNANILLSSSKNGMTSLGWSFSKLENLFGIIVLTHL